MQELTKKDTTVLVDDLVEIDWQFENKFDEWGGIVLKYMRERRRARMIDVVQAGEGWYSTSTSRGTMIVASIIGFLVQDSPSSLHLWQKDFR